MKNLIVVLAIICVSQIDLLAHDADVAYFDIESSKDQIVVHAELPWTLRTALMDFCPELEDTRDASKHNEALYQYFDQNLKLYSTTGAISMLTMREVNVDGHSHQVNYEIIYAGAELYQIENTMLFSIHKKQKNHHTIASDGVMTKQMTTHAHPIITTTTSDDISSPSLIWMSLILPLILFLKK